MRICVLDLGGMSFHLLHVRSTGSGHVARLGSLRMPTGLGRNTMRTGVLDKESWERGLHDLGVLAREAQALAPDKIVAVATSAIRAASNAHAFVAEAKRRYGIEIKVLSEQQEAELCYRGAISEIDDWMGAAAVVDLGGGSCEVAVGEGARFIDSYSADIGVLPLREAFGIVDVVGPVKASAMSEVVRMSLRPAMGLLRSGQPERLVLASGAARAVYRLGQGLFRGGLPPRQLTGIQARAIRDYVVGRHPSEFSQYGVDPERLEVIAISVIVLETIMSQFACLTASISNRGLREGVALKESSLDSEFVHSNKESLSGEFPTSLN